MPRLLLGGVVALLMAGGLVLAGWFFFFGMNWISFLPYMFGGLAIAFCVDLAVRRLRS